MTPINNPLVPDPMSSSLDPASLAKSAVGKGITHQYQSSIPQSTTKSTSSGGVGGIGIGTNLISGIPTDSSNKFTFLDPSQLGMGIESCLSELQTNFRNSLNEANAKSDGCNDPNNNNNLNNSNNNNSQNQNLSSMTRDSSLVNLAIIPSLNSTQSFTHSYTYNNNTTLNDNSLESEYGMTFIDFPTGGIDPSTLPPPES